MRRMHPLFTPFRLHFFLVCARRPAYVCHVHTRRWFEDNQPFRSEKSASFWRNKAFKWFHNQTTSGPWKKPNAVELQVISRSYNKLLTSTGGCIGPEMRYNVHATISPLLPHSPAYTCSWSLPPTHGDFACQYLVGRWRNDCDNASMNIQWPIWPYSDHYVSVTNKNYLISRIHFFKIRRFKQWFEIQTWFHIDFQHNLKIVRCYGTFCNDCFPSKNSA